MAKHKSTKKHNVPLDGLICVPRVHRKGSARTGTGQRYIYPKKSTHLCFDPSKTRSSR